MEQSIENIWKTGFANPESGIPKIEHLEDLKSMYFIDQFKARYQLNVILLGVTAILVLFAFTLGGIPFIGLFMFFLFITLAIMGRLELRKLNQLNQGASSYDYISSFDTWLKHLLRKFSVVYRIWVPLLFVGFVLALLHTNVLIPFLGEPLVEVFFKESNAYKILGLPLLWIMGLTLLAVLLSYGSNYLFRLEIKSIYGDLIHKLDVLLADLQELR